MRGAGRIALVVATALALAGCQMMEPYNNRPPPPQQIAYGPATERQLQRALSHYSALMVQMGRDGDLRNVRARWRVGTSERSAARPRRHSQPR